MSTTKEAPAPVKEPIRAEKAPDPFEQPVQYLRYHGWRTQGMDPRTRRALWLDPTKPKKEIVRKEHAYTKKLPNGEEQEVYQTIIEPEAWPTPQDEAVDVQMERDRQKREAQPAAAQ
jgi:hypothetical protein